MTAKHPSLKYGQYPLWFLALVLVVIAASRLSKLPTLELHNDELWSIWQTFGSLNQIITWTPPDWPPLYFVALAAWEALVGIQPFGLQVSSVLLFLISVSLLYRIIRRLRDEPTALMVMVVYSSLAFSIRISTEVRGYMLMMTLFIAAFWFMLRYFDHPSLRRAIPLALSMVAAFYVWLPSVLGFLMLGVYTLIVYPRRVWRWLIPGIPAAILAVPLIINKIQNLSYQINKPIPVPPASFIDGILNYFKLYTGYNYIDYPIVLWIGLFVVATVVLLYRWRSQARVHGAWLAWAVGLPILMYILNPWLKFFDNHYSMALMLGFAIWIGWGLALLPRWPSRLIVMGLGIVMLMPFQLRYPEYFWRPWIANMNWLSERIQPDDVLLIDPNKGVDKYFEWAYFSKVYFPSGLKFVTKPEGHRRVWYVTFEGKRDPATDAAVREGRVEREFVGPANFFFRLYEAPPDPVGVLFDNGMRFHGVDFLDSSGQHYLTGPLVTYHTGDSVRMRIWWSVDRQITADYSIATSLTLPGGEVMDQFDGPPQVVSLEYPPQIPPLETSRWQPGQFYLEERTLVLPLPDKGYHTAFRVYMTVYQWWDNTRISAPGVNEDKLFLLQRFNIESW